VTLRRDCRCACHAALGAVVHVYPCCGPGSVGWEHESTLPAESDPYKTLSLFGSDEENKPVDAAPSEESSLGKSQW